MAEWFKAINCKFIKHLLNIGSNPIFFKNVIINSIT